MRSDLCARAYSLNGKRIKMKINKPSTREIFTVQSMLWSTIDHRLKRLHQREISVNAFFVAHSNLIAACRSHTYTHTQLSGGVKWQTASARMHSTAKTILLNRITVHLAFKSRRCRLLKNPFCVHFKWFGLICVKNFIGRLIEIYWTIQVTSELAIRRNVPSFWLQLN